MIGAARDEDLSARLEHAKAIPEELRGEWPDGSTAKHSIIELEGVGAIEMRCRASVTNDLRFKQIDQIRVLYLGDFLAQGGQN